MPNIRRWTAYWPTWKEEHRDWILAAVAYALRGNPNRRIYVLEGPPGGGKTTLLNAVRACLG